MAYGESRAARLARLENQRSTFPELASADARTVFAVDRVRRQEARTPTSVGLAIEAYDPSTPDVAPNVAGWAPQPMGPLNRYSSSLDEMEAGRREAEAIRAGTYSPQAPELTDPYARNVLENPLTLLDPGGPTRGLIFSALRGENPAEASMARDITRDRGIDLPLIRNLPDRGLQAGPLNLTPKTLGGVASEVAADPTTYAGLPVVDDAIGLAGRGIKAAGSRVFGKAATETAEAAAPRVLQMAGSAANTVDNMPPPSAAGSASQRLFQVKPPTQPLSRFDRALNVIKETVGIGVPEDDIATPIMRERRRVQSVVESQAARMGAVADETTRAFRTDAKGRIADLPGAPTIQDVAARLPQYEPYLDDAQRTALARLQREIEPFHDALLENGIDVRSRADVMDGGFYLPRGRADVEGADAVVKVGTGRGGAGGRKGFERGAVFDSMTEGIDAGYEYASLRDAVQSYAKDAGNRSIDAWAGNEFKATGLGEGINERLLRQEPALAAKHEALTKRLTGLRGSFERVDERLRETVDNYLANPEADLDQLYIDLGDAKIGGTVRETMTGAKPVGATGPNAGMTASQLRREIRAVRSQIADLRPEYNRALERARQTPRDQGSIGFSSLNGTTFPDEIANVANKYLQKERPPTGRETQALNAVRAFNGLMRGLRASSDVSFMGIQGLLGAVSHPKQYGQALWVAMKSMGDERAFGAFVQNFDDTARAAGRPDSRAWAAVGNRIGGTNTEFAIGRGLSRVGPAIQDGAIPLTRRIPGLRNGINPVRGSNRAFGTFGDTLRLVTEDALYGARQAAGKMPTTDEMAEIAKFSGLMTGWSERRFLGDTGALVQFAPRFFQSQLDLVGNAFTSRSIVGDEARKSLASLIGVGTLLTVGINEARGYETDFKPGSPNFMRIRNVGGTDISVFGSWDSLVRGVAGLADGDLTYFARSKASPVVALTWDLVSGKSFTGKDTRNAEYILRQFLPFSLADMGEKSIGQMAIGATGLKATPLSPSDRVSVGEFDQMQGEDQFKAIPAQAWKVVVDKAPEQYKDAAEYDSAYDFYQALIEEYTKGWMERGKSRLEAQARAEQSAANHPVYKAYIRARNHYEDQWTAQNPELRQEQAEAQLDLPPSERRNMPRKRERQIIEASR